MDSHRPFFCSVSDHAVYRMSMHALCEYKRSFLHRDLLRRGQRMQARLPRGWMWRTGRSGPPSLEPPASSLQVCRLFFLQVWSTSCLLIAGMSSFLLAGLVHFLPPHCRYVVFSSYRSGPPSLELPASRDGQRYSKMDRFFHR